MLARRLLPLGVAGLLAAAQGVGLADEGRREGRKPAEGAPAAAATLAPATLPYPPPPAIAVPHISFGPSPAPADAAPPAAKPKRDGDRHRRAQRTVVVVTPLLVAEPGMAGLAAPGEYVQPPADYSGPDSGYLYFCPGYGYYPQVPTCPVGWQRLAVPTAGGGPERP